MNTTSTAFDLAFKAVVGHEGGYTKDRDDKGNWTGGVVGSGELKGTKYGISAAAYPRLDIERLTLQEAKAIYERDYWRACACDLLPLSVAHQVFDAAVQHGTTRAIKLLQQALGVTADGKAGPITRAAAKAQAGAPLLLDFLAARQLFYTDISTWAKYGRGWMKRMAAQMLQAAADIREA